ncbi:MAG: hypothetical protein KGJ38_17245 [Burkholderiaceae bacterium]|jgi:hypothetical protein|nr:hypothetical protein [Burkholderiaceae bacterium]
MSEAADGSATPATQIDAYQLTGVPVAGIDANQVLRMHFLSTMRCQVFFWALFCYAETGNANTGKKR